MSEEKSHRRKWKPQACDVELSALGLPPKRTTTARLQTLFNKC
jgi:hypothetical protein